MAKFLWTERTNFGPSPRAAGAATWDSNRGRTVLFGGSLESKGDNGETWEWDGSYWTQMSDLGPSARSYSALVYDSANKVSLLFSGSEGGIPIGDTWQWDGLNWTQLAETGPPPRSGHAMAYDSNRQRTVLFGGVASDVSLFGDTWEFDGENWTQQQDTGPSARRGHGMAFDSVNGRVVLFGGGGTDTAGLGDTWAWDGQEWVEIAAFGPPPRINSSVVSIAGAALILYGGASSLTGGSQVYFDTWQFDGKLWTQRQDIGPGPLYSAAMAFDVSRSAVVLFGGLNSLPSTDAALSGDTWESTVPAGGTAGAGLVRVTSIAFQSPVLQQIPTQMTLTLSAPVPQPTIVLLSGPVFQANGQNLDQVEIPAETTTFSQQVAFAAHPTDPGVVEVTIQAQVQGTPSVSAIVSVE
jgi:hypothetical protein